MIGFGGMNAMIPDMITDWSTSISIKVPGSFDRYNQTTYTSSTIQGRLVLTNIEILTNDNQKLIADAKIFTLSDLSIGTLVVYDSDDYSILSKKAARDKDNNIAFYKYCVGKV
jgi:hypothetical protein